MPKNVPKPLEKWQAEDAARLTSLCKKLLKGETQAQFGLRTGIGNQSMVSQYQRGERALNIEAARKFADGLGVLIDEFSPTLAKQIAKANERIEQETPASDHAPVRLLDARASAGNGSLVFSENVATAKQILEWIGLITGGVGGVAASCHSLFALLKWLRGRAINRVVLLDNGLMRVELEEDHIEVERQIIDLYRQFNLRKALERVLKPLESDGIDQFAATNKEQTEQFTVVLKSELPYFMAPSAESEMLSEQEIEMNLQLVNVAFREDNKWRFSDGTTAFYAQVLDEDFLRQVQSNEPFSNGDILKAKLRRTQYLSGETMKTEYALLRVLEHRRAPAQIPMHFEREAR